MMPTTPSRRRPASLVAAFRLAVQEHAAAPALEAGSEVLSYAELDELSGRLAGALAASGVRPGDFVGVALERGFELVIALLAIVKAGAAYVPLDRSYPRERLALMIEETAARRVLCRAASCDALPPAAPLFLLDEEAWQQAERLPAAREVDAGSEQPVYVIFTSGSTGRPKGVLTPQRGVLNLVFAASYLDFTPGLRIPQLSNISFDAATFEIWGTLLHGGTLLFFEPGAVLAPSSLQALLEKSRVDALFVTTALFNQLVRHHPGFFRSVRHVLFGGERSDASAVRAALGDPPGQLIHVYGPTETTTFATFEPVRHLSPDATAVSLGFPIGGTHTRLLDRDLRPLEPGEEGELLIGGEGLALGYLGRPALTAASFVPDPASAEPGARLYRSGDLMRLLPGGELEFRGRVDHQVKVRGYRIELGEIEAALSAHPAIGAAIVEPRRESSGALQLIAYLVPRGAAMSTEELRSFLGRSLPDYMIPARFVFLAALPLSPNGKVDRRALPALAADLEGDLAAADAAVAPRDELEEKIAAIFAAVLGLPQVSVTANFFALGGHSLLAIQLLSRLRDQLGVELPMRVLFEAPSIAGLAAALREGAPPAAAASSVELPAELSGEVAPLSFAQRSLYFLFRLHPESAAYNQPLVFELHGALNVPALARAIDYIVARHEALRTRFVEVAGEPKQWVTPAEPCELVAEKIDDDDALVIARISQEMYRPFDLARGPVQRVSLFERAPDRYVFLWNTHHIVTDGWSLGVMHAELNAFYTAFAAGQEIELDPLPMQFADVARAQEELRLSGALAAHLDYWREQLRDLPLCELPGDSLRPPTFSYRGEALSDSWPSELSQGLRLLARKSRSSLFTVLLTAWSVLLARWLQRNEVVLGIPQGGRDELEHEGMVGFFVNMLVLRTRLDADLTFSAALAEVKTTLAAGQKHAVVPFDQLVAELAPQRDPARHPFFQISFQVLPGGMMGDQQLGEIELRPLPLRLEASKFDLSITVHDRPQGLILMIEYASDLYRASTARFILESLRTLAAALVAAEADPPLAQLPIEPFAGRPRERRCELSYAQQRMFFLKHWDRGSALYNIPFATRWRGSFDEAAFRRALEEICARHEVLRCRYLSDRDGTARLEIDPPGPLQVEAIELGTVPAAQREERLRDEIDRLARHAFDLEAEWPLHVAILQLGQGEVVVSTVFHHIAFDGWSFEIFLRELAELYAAREAAPASLTPLPWQYADFAEWQRRFLEGGEMERQLAFWRDRLLDFEGQLELPTDSPRPARTRHRGNTLRRRFDPATTSALRAVGQARGATAFLTFLAAWAALLSRLGHQKDLAVGIPVAGRHRPETEGLIGFFVNTLVLRLNAHGDPTFLEWLDRVRDRALDAFAHQDLPFEKLVEELRPERDPARNPFFQVIFQWLPGSDGPLRLGDTLVEPIAPDTGTAKFDLNLTLVESPEGVGAALEYDIDLFRRDTIEGWLDAYERLLAALASAPSLRLSQLPLLGAEERGRLLGALRGEPTPYPRDSSLAELFLGAAQCQGDAAAVQYGERRLSYRQLDLASSRVARALLARGIGYGDFVGIFLERSPEMIVATLGVIRAGAAYAPLDLTYPADRLAFMIEETAMPLLLTSEELLPLLPAARPPCLDVAALLADEGGAEDVSLPPRGHGALPAYVIYTSGSTGKPKGVVVPQRAITRLVRQTNYVDLGPDDRMAQIANVSFDAATFEIWGALLNGAQLIGIDKNTVLQASALSAVLAERKISAFFLTAALFQQIASQRPEAFRSVRHAIFGGDRSEVRPVQLALEAGCRGLANGYGPTECTTFAVVHRISSLELDATSVPIGQVISNTEALVLDEDQQLVPLGVVGELYLGGDGLAFGYLKRPALTARSFVPHPFPRTAGERLYRTGDLVRRLRSGELDFVGRVDFQVKLRGFRIELGEIEAALARHPGVAAQLVMVREDEPGERRLVAYVQRRAGTEGTPLDAELRAELKAGLPDFMVPSSIVVLDLLPLTPNGKIDRRALPAPERQESEGARRPPGSALERLLAQVWADVLGTPQVFLDDNFFELGGHSLLATKIFARLTEALGVELPLHLVFEAATLESFSAAVLDHLRGLGVADDLLALLEELETMSEEEKKALLETRA